MRGTIKGVLFSLLVVLFFYALIYGVIAFILLIFNSSVSTLPFTLIVTFILLALLTRLGIRQLKKENNQFGHGIITGTILMCIIWVTFLIIAIL
jgi:hypothetical protein